MYKEKQRNYGVSCRTKTTMTRESKQADIQAVMNLLVNIMIVPGSQHWYSQRARLEWHFYCTHTVNFQHIKCLRRKRTMHLIPPITNKQNKRVTGHNAF